MELLPWVEMDGQTGNSQILDIQTPARGIISAFVHEATTILAPNVVSIAATGSCITSDYIPGKSDINSVLVLKDMEPSFLDKLSSMGRHFSKKKMRAPLIMTPEYIENSLDVFPVEFLDIKMIHRTVYGEDLFSDIVINKSQLRLQCERDLKAKLINLHQGYISCMGDGKGLKTLLSSAYPGYFPLFRAMLFITQITRPISIHKADVLKDMESGFDVSFDVFRDIHTLSMKRGFLIDSTSVKDSFIKLYRITYDLAHIMDRLSA